MRKFTILLFPILCFFLSGCRLFGKLTLADSRDWIPKDFHPKTDFLLIQVYPFNEAINKKMIDYLEKGYRGKYEVVVKQTILSKADKYAEIDVYHFALLWDTTVMYGNNNGNPTKPVAYFYDRATNKNYPTTKKRNQYQFKNSYKAYINTIDQYYKR